MVIPSTGPIFDCFGKFLRLVGGDFHHVLDKAAVFGRLHKSEKLIPQVVVIMLGFGRLCISTQEGSQSFVDNGVIRPYAELLFGKKAEPKGGDSCGNLSTQCRLIQSDNSALMQLA